MKKHIISSVFAIIFIVMTLVLCATAIGADDNYIDITALTPKSQSVGYGSLCVNKDLNGGKINIANAEGELTVYEKGFVAHATSDLKFDVSGYTKEIILFSVYIGTDNNPSNATTASTSMIFRVKADNKVLFESEVITYTTPAQLVQVAIPAGTKTISLIADADGSNYGDHAAWAEPRLYSDASALEEYKSATFTTPVKVLHIGETAQLEYSIINLAEKPLTPDILTFTSSDSKIASVSSTGEVQAHKKGDVVLTMKGKKGNTTFEKSVNLTVIDVIEEKSFTLNSPNGAITMHIRLDGNGVLQYSVDAKDGSTVLCESIIGINTASCNFSYALEYNTASEVKKVTETYTIYSGKRSTVENIYNEMVVSFKRSDYFFDVYFRGYDEGFAYRFSIRKQDGSTVDLPVIEETGTFVIPENSTIYAQFLSSVHNNFGHEQRFVTTKLSSAKGVTAMPQLLNLEGKGNYLMLCESDLYGDSYAGSAMRCIGNDTLQICFAPRDEGVTITTNFTSPWRFGVYGTLGDIVESDMTEKLGTPSEGDYSWVEPGVTAWTWLSEGYAGQSNKDIIKDYIDLSHEMGWKYLILDEGWNTSGRNPYCKYYTWFPSIVEYAEERGVGLIAWVYTPNIIRNDDGTFDLSFISDYAKEGVKGVKIDFFDSEDQETINLYDELYKECAKYKLIVNCHGANIPKGERRTYPNVINREAALTEEYGGLFMDIAMYWPYTRNVSGPIDITPRLYPTGGATTVAQMAVNIIFESGMPCMAGKSQDYREFHANSFYKHLPATWDDIHFIDGTVGSWVSLARRSGDVWYASVMACSAKNGEMSLDFLGDGKYYAVIYSEESRTDVRTEIKVVTNKDTLSYSVLADGGYIVKFVPEDKADVYLPTAIETEDNITVIVGNSTAINYTLVGDSIEIDGLNFTSSNPEILAVNSMGVMTGIKSGTATVTISSIANEKITKTVTVKVKPAPYKLDSHFTMIGTDKNYLPSLDFEKLNRIYLTCQPTSGNNYNELRYPVPDGDFVMTVRLGDAIKENGNSAGVIVRSGDQFISVTRGHDGEAYTAFSSSSISLKKLGKDYGGNFFVSVRKEGDTITVLTGKTQSSLTKRGTISVTEEITFGMFASSGNRESAESVAFVGLVVNDTEIPFAVPADTFEESPAIKGYKAYVNTEMIKFYLLFDEASVGKDVSITFKGETVTKTVAADGIVLSLTASDLEETVTVKSGENVVAEYSLKEYLTAVTKLSSATDTEKSVACAILNKTSYKEFLPPVKKEDE